MFFSCRTPFKHRLAVRAAGAIVAGASVSSAIMATAHPAQAQSAADLQRQIDALQKQVEALKTEQTKATKNVVKGGDLPGSFKLPGTETSMKIGGYVKGDLFYTDGNGKVIGDSFYAPAIPVSGSAAADQSGVTRAHARQSRINVQTQTPTDFGDLKTFIEGDFFGTGGNQNVSNSTSLRLRHAYGTLGNVLVGQTWTTFMDLSSLPDTVDFEGTAGQIFVRQAQVRYTQPFGGGSFAVALENPEGDIAGDGGNNFDRFPDLVGRLQLGGDWGSLHLAGVLRDLRVDNSTTDTSKIGWGLTLAGKFMVTSKDNIIGQLNYGDGIGRYIEGGSGFGGTFVNQKVDAIPIGGGFAGFQHFWRDNLQSTLVYGRTQFDNPSSLGLSATKFIQTVHANIMWQPVSRVNLGLEVIWGEHELESGANGTATRYQFGAKYSF